MDTELHLGYGVMGSSAEILAEGGQAPPLQPKTPPSPGVGSLQSMSSAVTATDLLPYQPYSAGLPKETWYWLSLQVRLPSNNTKKKSWAERHTSDTVTEPKLFQNLICCFATTFFNCRISHTLKQYINFITCAKN